MTSGVPHLTDVATTGQGMGAKAMPAMVDGDLSHPVWTEHAAGLLVP